MTNFEEFQEAVEILGSFSIEEANTFLLTTIAMMLTKIADSLEALSKGGQR